MPPIRMGDKFLGGELRPTGAVTAIPREALLAVRNLKTYFPQDEGTVKAVE